jgi:branched-chain amino acid transport system permease protein
MALLISGLTTGAVYALLAIGVVLIFRASGIVNFAQGEIMMVSAYAYVLVSDSADAAPLQLAAALAAGAAGGLLCFVVAHILLHRSTRIAQVIGTLALLILLQAGARYLFTDNPFRAEVWIFGEQNLDILGTSLPVNSVMILAVTVIATAALFYWQGSTLSGSAVRAVAEDPWRAALSGIHVRSTLAVSWAVGGMLAGVAGVLVSPLMGVFPTMGADIILPAFIGAVLGGFSSILGALIGGLALGLIQTYAVVAFGGAMKEVVMVAVFMLVLLWRPTGILTVERARRI